MNITTTYESKEKISTKYLNIQNGKWTHFF